MQKVNLNLIPGSVLPVINVSQYDEGRQFQLAVFNGAASYDLTGKTVMVDVQKTDGHGCEYGATDEVHGVPVVAVSGNIVTITTPQQMTACAGDCAGELKITDSTSTIGTLNFVLMCEPAPLNDGTIISDTELPAIIDAARSSAARAEDAAQDAEAAAAHYPYIGDDNYWYEWDVETEQFVKTDVSAAGRAPDITMTATADATSSSTPAVTVTKTGTDEEPNFALAFSGLKGAKGDTGPIGPTGDSQDVLEAVGWVGSNLFEGNKDTFTWAGITVTPQNNGTYLLTGTRTSTGGMIPYRIGTFLCKAGVEYKVSGCPTGGGTTSSDFRMNVYRPGTGDVYAPSDIGSGTTIPAFSQDTEVELGFNLPQSFVCPANFLWSPMISRNGGAYTPYHPTVQEELWDGEVSEPKNLLPTPYYQTSATTGTVAIKANDDGTVTVGAGTAGSSNKSFVLKSRADSNYTLPAGKYYLSGIPSNAPSGVILQFQCTRNGSLVNLGQADAGEAVLGAILATDLLQVVILISANTVISSALTFSPMICTEEDWEKSHAYSPYYVPLKDVVPTKFNNSNVAPTEDGATASQSIAVNDLFIRGGALCICDQPISSGGSFTEGTNYHKTTLAAVIAALRA